MTDFAYGATRRALVGLGETVEVGVGAGLVASLAGFGTALIVGGVLSAVGGLLSVLSTTDPT
jgi:ABC-type antimicrobial peptide transport system permease subunit